MWSRRWWKGPGGQSFLRGFWIRHPMSFAVFSLQPVIPGCLAVAFPPSEGCIHSDERGSGCLHHHVGRGFSGGSAERPSNHPGKHLPLPPPSLPISRLKISSFLRSPLSPSSSSFTLSGMMLPNSIAWPITSSKMFTPAPTSSSTP